MLDGDLVAASRRFDSQGDLSDADIESRLDDGERRADLQLWLHRPEAALQTLRPVLAAAAGTDMAPLAGWLLALAARAAADFTDTLLGDTRRRSTEALSAELTSLHDALHPDPFACTVPVTSGASCLTWHAELGRGRGDADPDAWHAAADAWDQLLMAHRSAYCRWRQAEALLATRGPRDHAREALRTGKRLAEGHQPLTEAIKATAARARIALTDSLTADTAPTSSDDALHLTDRERAVLRLLTEGKTNADIGRQLFISPKTASVHVTSILRKLGVQSRTHAAAIAERSGLLHDP